MAVEKQNGYKAKKNLQWMIHRYLHHLEGENGNGNYWYYRSGYDLPDDPDEKWSFILEQVSRLQLNIPIKEGGLPYPLPTGLIRLRDPSLSLFN